ncbi:hypothetical protein CP8484711_1868 [Chlamydia psittaci 84-8471/1]|nr:hypothetical protein B602_0847 [Chlamydia psittaci M56]EPJ21515.1 hypothetical protein CP02DC21_0172 [Chlamydia psittaci 02DC21]EPJ25644.1 hypothetical protein CP09DC77_0176 [Chlamydia psittaci 09DC77]EPL00145.1 hypothetical protein CP02DC14_0177 [Chlamydia psittaci 02DC14]EPP34224.1 hypothetical protein CPC698_0065 [Chlamydia psittaci C6/98]EPP36394.1 hypothetical protein CP8484711_1868 [Chlamydia psittaci 84-8471/1]
MKFARTKCLAERHTFIPHTRIFMIIYLRFFIEFSFYFSVISKLHQFSDN